MVGNRFCRYELQTTDVEGARAFYATILGPHFWDSSDISMSRLSERAIARGAPSHWLGHISVGDVDAIVARLIDVGAEQLGPTRRGSKSSSNAILRDPFGAVFAASSESTAASSRSVAWHLMHTREHEPAFAAYAALFGWTATELRDLGPELGCHQVFAWDESGTSVGSVANTALSPRIHTQWMFFFPVSNMDIAVAEVRARGGIVVDVMPAWDGALAAPCDDPQGAAFALYQVNH